jgi:hypothetical protein
MPRRLYLCEFVYNAEENDCSPAIKDYAAEWTVLAERNRRNDLPGAKCIVAAEVTLASHAAAIADPRIVHLPLERIVGRLADDGDTIADLTAVQRNAIRSRLEALGIDLSDVQGSWTVQRFVREMRERIHALAAKEPAP